jgi:hypothetical protein
MASSAWRELDDVLQGDDIGLAVLAIVNGTSVTAVQVLDVQA